VIDEIRDVEQKHVTGVLLRNVKNGETREFACDGVFMGIGHKPNTDVFKGLLDLDDHGYVVTRGGTTRTSAEGVFAAGDVADPRYRQGVSAAGTGCMAAIDAQRYLEGEPPPLDREV